MSLLKFEIPCCPLFHTVSHQLISFHSDCVPVIGWLQRRSSFRVPDSLVQSEAAVSGCPDVDFKRCLCVSSKWLTDIRLSCGRALCLSLPHTHSLSALWLAVVSFLQLPTHCQGQWKHSSGIFPPTQIRSEHRASFICLTTSLHFFSDIF